MNKQQLKALIKLMKSPGIAVILGDTIRVYCEEVRGESEEGDKYYAEMANKIIKHLLGTYEQQYRDMGRQSKVKQIDLEDSIREITAEIEEKKKEILQTKQVLNEIENKYK